MASPIQTLESQKGISTPDYQPTPEEKRDVGFIQQQVEAGERAMRPFRKQTWEGLAFFTGQQWAEYDNKQGRMHEKDKAEHEARLVENQIARAVRTASAALTRNKPGWSVVPATDDESDKECARASARLLEHCWRQLKMSGKSHEYVMWDLVTGLAAFRVWWDTTAGDDYLATFPVLDEQGQPVMDVTPILDEMGAPVLDEMGQPAVSETPRTEERVTKTGYPSIEVCPVTSLVIDPGCASKDLDDCQWVAQNVYMHVDAIREQWPERGEMVRPDTAFTIDGPSTQTVTAFQGTNSAAPSKDEGMDRAKVTFYFERPSKRHEKGWCAVVAGGVMLEQTEELPRGKLPFALSRFNPVPGRLIGMGMVADAISPQRTLNGQLSTYVESCNLIANNKWAVQKGSLVNAASAITNQPGEIIEYLPGFQPPQQITPAPVSPEHARIMEMARQQIRDSTGVSEFQQGTVDAAISGRALAMIAELYATMLGPAARELEDAMSVVGTAILELWRDRMPIDQTVKTLGKDNQWISYEFHASEITSTDVRVLEGSMTPSHPSVKRESIMMAAGSGILGDLKDPEVRARIQDDLEFGNTEDVYGTTNAETQYAREENHGLLTGLDWQDAPLSSPIKARPIDNHTAHIRIHTALGSSDLLRHGGPDAENRLLDHIAEHEAYKAMVAQGVPWWTQRAAGRIEGAPMQAGQPAAQPTDAPTMESTGMGAPPLPSPSGAQLPQLGIRGPGIGLRDGTPAEMTPDTAGL